MATPGEKSFCVLEYHMSKSVVTVQHAFRAKYAKDPPKDKTICAWYKQFTEVKNIIIAPMLMRVWQELKYSVDVCRVTHGAHIEHL